MQQAAAGTTQVASNITEVNRGAAETGSASSQVLSSAQSLSSESSHLKLEVDKFLATRQGGLTAQSENLGRSIGLLSSRR